MEERESEEIKNVELGRICSALTGQVKLAKNIVQMKSSRRKGSGYSHPSESPFVIGRLLDRPLWE